jgi:hypothetical protein
MRKLMISCVINLFVVILLTLEMAASALAVVAGDCNACHTVFPGMTEKTFRAKPFEYVPRETFCVKCHSSNTSETIVEIGGNRVPIVFNNAKPVKPLAGGDFYYVAFLGERKGHNVNGVASRDVEFAGSPPAYKRALDPSSIGYNPQKPLACAGSNGCHGNRNIEDPFEAIFGSHHAINTPPDGSTTARSYRFLRNSDAVKGVTGLEDDEWNQNATPKKHNEYTSSIDVLCRSCHGGLQSGHAGKHFNHLVGVPMPAGGEYVKYRIYDPDAPVAREIASQVSSDAVTPGKDLVMCLSCHVAHASPYDSELRWDYDNIFTEGKRIGCLICHTNK